MKIIKYSKNKIQLTMTGKQLEAIQAALDSCCDAAAHSGSKLWDDIDRVDTSLTNALFKMESKET